MDYELLLQDRLGVIRQTNAIYNLLDNSYLSFSGGKDSTILHYLLDIALPNNNIPRVYIDTGIEYRAIREFVMSLAEHDERFVIIKPSKPIKQVLETYGYPFKSKEHSLRVEQYNEGKNSNYIQKYISGIDKKGKPTSFACPKLLLYQFENKGAYNYSNKCCLKLKKEPAKKWAKANNKTIILTGMRKEEGGNRARLGCIITDKNGKLQKFHPLIVVDEEWENEFIKHNNIKLCKLYYEPFNFKRTGCVGCPFSLTLENDLQIMEKFLPSERKMCEMIWKPVYQEYRRLNYRLHNQEQLSLLNEIKEISDGN